MQSTNPKENIPLYSISIIALAPPPLLGYIFRGLTAYNNHFIEAIILLSALFIVYGVWTVFELIEEILKVKLRKSKAKAKANAFTVALQFRHIDNLPILLSGILYHDFFSPIPILAVPFPAMEHVPIFSFT